MARRLRSRSCLSDTSEDSGSKFKASDGARSETDVTEVDTSDPTSQNDKKTVVWDCSKCDKFFSSEWTSDQDHYRIKEMWKVCTPIREVPNCKTCRTYFSTPETAIAHIQIHLKRPPTRKLSPSLFTQPDDYVFVVNPQPPTTVAPQPCDAFVAGRRRVRKARKTMIGR